MSAAVPQPLQILHGGGVALACAPDGTLHAEDEHGLFAGDTRVLSTWRQAVEGVAWLLLARTRPGPSTAQWHFQNPAIRVPAGEIAEGRLHLRVRRRVRGAMHECVELCAYGTSDARVRFELLADADFADLFEVHAHTIPPRLDVRREARPDGVVLRYERPGFRRALHLCFAGGTPSVVGSRLVFDLHLRPGEPWRCCVEARPEVDGKVLGFVGDPHACEQEPALDAPRLSPEGPLARAWRRGVSDLAALRIALPDGREVTAAGAPWFMALFGRDTLVTALMAGLVPDVAGDALDALGAWQARADDPFRDAEPGKLPHELRVGELATFKRIPHTPYYGTHDAPALFALALWSAWRWTGDARLLAAHLPVARAGMAWCRASAARDGDGLLAYKSRSRLGYLNQAWKDAGDAIVHVDGRHAAPPIATVELQGDWYAAELAMAELLDAAGDPDAAREARETAEALRARVEARFWMEEEGTYALAVDGAGRPVASASSNPGQLLWSGLPSPERARRVARRLLADDLFSGWGLRTLASTHVAYNPMSYQLGSVWPHDTALFAAGLVRYGLRAEAGRVLGAVLDAAEAFEDQRLPELFCGFPREIGPPVPYARANAPQAWAAAVPVLAVHLLLGLVPDAPRGRCTLSPWLPDWLPGIDVRGVRVGAGTLDVRLRRGEPERIEAHGVDVAVAEVEGALWGVRR